MTCEEINFSRTICDTTASTFDRSTAVGTTGVKEVLEEWGGCRRQKFVVGDGRGGSFMGDGGGDTESVIDVT